MQGAGALSAYGDFSSSGSGRAAALCCKWLRTKPGRSAFEAWRAGEATAMGLQNRLDFALLASGAVASFERRLKPSIDAIETVLDRIMTYRTPLAGMAFCADGRPLRNAR